jgi:hypothetical protein
MTTMRTSLFLSLCALAACKGRPKHQPAPANAQTGSNNGAPPAPDLVLPHSDGSPIKPTTAKLDAATLDKLQGMTFQGFNSVPHGLGADHGMMEVQQRTRDRPTIWAVITVAPCAENSVMVSCLPMDLGKWENEPRYSELKNIMPPELRAQPDTIFEVGTADVAGTKMIFSYQLGQTTSHPSAPNAPGSAFNPGGFAFTDAYFLYYNDGINTIRVVAEYKDDPKTSKDEMAQVAPKGDLENVAKAFMDAYTHAW